MAHDERDAARRQLLETPAAELAARRAEIQAHAEAAGYSKEEIREILNSRADLPRPLLPEERDALLLSFESLDEPTRAALRAQVAAVTVSGYDCACPCATVGLVVDKTKAPPAPVRETPFGDVSINDPDGEPIGGVLISIADGCYLSSIEIYSYGEPLSPIPPREQLVVEPPTYSFDSPIGRAGHPLRRVWCAIRRRVARARAR
jgi:hypothetical protein